MKAYIKGFAYRLGILLVKWSDGPRANLFIAHLPMKEYQYKHFHELASLRGLSMEELPGHLLRQLVRESQEEIWSLKKSDDLFPNHK